MMFLCSIFITLGGKWFLLKQITCQMIVGRHEVPKVPREPPDILCQMSSNTAHIATFWVHNSSPGPQEALQVFFGPS
jgi:hypothetical protein